MEESQVSRLKLALLAQQTGVSTETMTTDNSGALVLPGNDFVLPLNECILLGQDPADFEPSDDNPNNMSKNALLFNQMKNSGSVVFFLPNVNYTHPDPNTGQAASFSNFNFISTSPNWENTITTGTNTVIPFYNTQQEKIKEEAVIMEVQEIPAEPVNVMNAASAINKKPPKKKVTRAKNVKRVDKPSTSVIYAAHQNLLSPDLINRPGQIKIPNKDLYHYFEKLLELFTGMPKGCAPVSRPGSLRKCLVCDKSCVGNLEVHIKSHLGWGNMKNNSIETKVVCLFCNCRFTSPSVVLNHQRKFKPNSFPCWLCDNVSYSEGELRDHVFKIHDNYRFRVVNCSECGIRLDKIDIFTDHMISKHPMCHVIYFGKDQILPISFCTQMNRPINDSFFQTISPMFEWQEVAAKPAPQAQATVSAPTPIVINQTPVRPVQFFRPVTAEGPISLPKRLLTAEREAELAALSTPVFQNFENQVTCDNCHMVFPSERYLNIHKDQSTSKLYPCSICALTFRSKNNLKLHLRSHFPTDSNVLKCLTCQEFLHTKYKFANHVFDNHLFSDIVYTSNETFQVRQEGCFVSCNQP